LKVPKHCPLVLLVKLMHIIKIIFITSQHGSQRKHHSSVSVPLFLLNVIVVFLVLVFKVWFVSLIPKSHDRPITY
jgi:hypothetical protein